VAEFVSKAPVAPDLQWEVSTDNGVTWNAISGANAESYTIVAASVGLDRNQYRLSATRDDLTVVSEAAVLRVGDTPVAVPANVVAHYRFEEGENPGDPAMGAQDSSGNENHLVNMAGSPFFSD